MQPQNLIHGKDDSAYYDIGKKIEWVAVYENGKESLWQYDPKTGEKHTYPDIDRKRLTQFVLLADKKPAVVVHMDKFKQLIYRRRIEFKPVHREPGKPFVGKKRKRIPVYIVGWHEHRDGVNIQIINAYFPDGHIETVDRFNENHPWFYYIMPKLYEAFEHQILDINRVNELKVLFNNLPKEEKTKERFVGIENEIKMLMDRIWRH